MDGVFAAALWNLSFLIDLSSFQYANMPAHCNTGSVYVPNMFMCHMFEQFLLFTDPHVFPMLPHYHHFNMTRCLLYSELSSKHITDAHLLLENIYCKKTKSVQLIDGHSFFNRVALGAHLVEISFHKTYIFIAISHTWAFRKRIRKDLSFRPMVFKTASGLSVGYLSLMDLVRFCFLL